jgi:hypothetical protein
MKNRNKIFLIFNIFLIATLFYSGCVENGDAVEYEVTFNASWSEETHPDDFPGNPHFSGLIGASHNEEVSFWKVGKLASSGIKNMAETGSKNPLNIEIGKAIINMTALDLISGDGISLSPGSTSLIFKVSQDYPLISLVTMIAPSPDWFVGVNSLNLYEDGSFVDEKTVILYAYDAGTDNGTSYKSPNDPTDPPQPIYKIEGYPFIYNDELKPIGNFVFKKLD